MRDSVFSTIGHSHNPDRGRQEHGTKLSLEDEILHLKLAMPYVGHLLHVLRYESTTLTQEDSV